MKGRIKCLLVFVSWMSLLVASVPVVAQNSPDVEVSDLQWTHDVNRGRRLKGYYARSPAPSPDFVQKVSATFRKCRHEAGQVSDVGVHSVQGLRPGEGGAYL